MHTLRTAFASLLVFVTAFAVQAQTGIKDIKISGTANEVQATATLTNKGTVTSAAGSTTDLQLGTVLLPTDVTRLGSSIDLSGAEATGILAAGRFPALTGDLSTTAGSLATTLATVNANVGSFGSATAVPVFTVNTKGLVTAASTTTITPAWSSITGKPTTISGYGITDAQPLDSDLTAIAALATTAYGRSFLALADAAAARTLIGLSSSSSPQFTALTLSGTTASTSTTTGTFTTGGGAGIAGNAYVGGNVIASGVVSSGGIDLSQTYQTRQTTNYLLFDGATSGRKGSATLGAAGAVSTMPITVLRRQKIPTTNPSTVRGLFTIGLNSGTANEGRALSAELRTNGDLWVTLTGATSSDFNRISTGGFRAAYSGLWTALAFVKTANGNPLFYLNGVAQSPTFSTSGTAPTWQGSITSTYLLDGLVSPSEAWEGPSEPTIIVLGEMTAGEVLEWTQTGRLPSWCEISTGSAVNRNDFTNAWGFGAGDSNSADTVGGGVTALAVSSEAGQRTGGTGAYFARGTNSSGTAVTFWTGNMPAGFPVVAGQRVLVKTWLRSSQNRNITELKLATTGAASTLASVNPAWLVTTDWQEFSTVVSTTATGTVRTFQIVMSSPGSAGGTIDQDDVQFTILGPVAKWEIQPGQTVAKDYGTNAIPLTLTSGVTAYGAPKEVVDNGSGTKTIASPNAPTVTNTQFRYSATPPYNQLVLFTNSGSLAADNASIGFTQNSGGAGNPGAGLKSGWITNVNSYFLDAFTSQDAGATKTLVWRGTPTGNLLIGGTTDISGSGGLKIFGTTASTSTTSGALQVAGGAGVVGAGNFGAQVTASYYRMSGVNAAVSEASGFITSSIDTGAAYPYQEYGNLVIASRSNGTGRDITFWTGSTLAEALRIGRTGNITVPYGQVTIATAKTPSSASDTGTAGTICWDSNYIYVCVATNTWKRVAISTW